MYVFAHLGSATPVAQKCAKGALYGDAPAYLPGMGKPAASTSSWVPLAVAGALGLGVIWWLARSATPVLAENPSDRIDPDELRRGTDHEMEHTSSRKVARRIALDHLREDPRYYKKLDEVEDAGFGALFAPNRRRDNPTSRAAAAADKLFWGATYMLGYEVVEFERWDEPKRERWLIKVRTPHHGVHDLYVYDDQVLGACRRYVNKSLCPLPADLRQLVDDVDAELSGEQNTETYHAPSAHYRKPTEAEYRQMEREEREMGRKLRRAAKRGDFNANPSGRWVWTAFDTEYKGFTDTSDFYDTKAQALAAARRAYPELHKEGDVYVGSEYGWIEIYQADWADNPSLQPGDRVCAPISLHHTGVTVSRGDCGTVIAVQKGRTYRTKTGFGSERHKTGDRVQIQWDRGAAGWHDVSVLEPMRENPKPKLVNFEIATRDGGSETRRGYVEGDYATHKDRYFWDFTHLPTGMLLSTYPVHETKASALAHLHELATVGPPEHVMRLLERYPGWGGSGKEKD